MGAPSGRDVSTSKILGRLSRQPTSTTLPAISALAVALLAIFAPAPAAAAAMAPTALGEQAGVEVPAALTVSLTSITPNVAVPKAPIVIRASVRNSSGGTLTLPMARALTGQSPLNSRQAVSDWATLPVDQPMDEVAQKSLGQSLAQGSVVAFTLTVPADAVSHSRPFAVIPLSIEVTGATPAATQASGAEKTYLPTLGAVKAFVPLSIAWLVPLTLDPNPALAGTASPARTAAWTKVIGPGSRLDKLIQGTENANVTWAIDPAILGPAQTPLPVDPSLTQPPPTSSGAAPPTQGGTAIADPVTGLTTALAQRLKSAAPGHTLWSLPYADPDLAALLPLTSGQSLAALISHPSTLDVAVGPARSDIAWPVTGALTPQVQAQLRSAFASSGLAAAVTPASTLTGHGAPTPDASSKSSSGLPLLAYDEPLSRTVAQTSSRADGPLTIQRFLADSMALLGERPGTPNRSVLVAEPRTFAGDPFVLRSLFAAVAKAPWLVPASTDQLLAASKKLAPDVPATNGSTSTSPTSTPRPSTPDLLSPGTSPLTSERLGRMPGMLSTIDGMASVLGDGPLFTSTWTDAQVQELSGRWRNHPHGLTVIDAATNSAIATVSNGVKVVPSSVNFFADRGVVQVTVQNDLDVPIHDVHLTLTPAQPRLRIERQPEPLKIGAKSRANVHVEVTSIAAGLVKVDAVLTTQNGTPLGQDSKVTIRVQPPASWIYWVLGGLAGIVLVLGTLRSLRRGSTRGSRPDAQEPSIDD
jgi:Family of unknown function (DUF6049)